MTRVITIAGGKGGIGKTTTAINLGFSLVNRGKDVTIVDANLTTPNVGVYLDFPDDVKGIHNVLDGEELDDCTYVHESGVKILPGVLSIEGLKKAEASRLSDKISEFKGITDLVLLDGSAGLGKESVFGIMACDEVLLVVNPELPSVIDGFKTAQVAKSLGKEVLGVVLNRRKGKNEMSVKEVEERLELPVLSVVPEDSKMSKAVLSKKAIVHFSPKSKSSKAYDKLACSIIGEPSKRGFFKKISGG